MEGAAPPLWVSLIWRIFAFYCIFHFLCLHTRYVAVSSLFFYVISAWILFEMWHTASFFVVFCFFFAGGSSHTVSLFLPLMLVILWFTTKWCAQSDGTDPPVDDTYRSQNRALYICICYVQILPHIHAYPEGIHFTTFQRPNASLEMWIQMLTTDWTLRGGLTYRLICIDWARVP